MAQQVATEVDWLLGHLRMMVATAPKAWARQNLTLPQLTALHFLHADSSLTLTGLAGVLGTGPPATSAMVDRLTEAGMVHRVPDVEHRSRVRFQVTAQAAQVLGDIDTGTARRFQAALQTLSPAQRQTVAAVLSDLVWQHITIRPSRDGSRRRSRVR